MLIRGESLAASMSQYLVDRIIDAEKISVRLRTHITAAHGETTSKRSPSRTWTPARRRRVPARAMFIFIGAVPHTDWVGEAVIRDEYGFIPTGPDLMVASKRPKGWMLDRDPYWLESSVPGVFVAGDVRREFDQAGRLGRRRRRHVGRLCAQVSGNALGKDWHGTVPARTWT